MDKIDYTKEEVKQINKLHFTELIRIAINYASSPKEKVVANALRAVGYILTKVNIEELANIFEESNKDNGYISKYSSQAW